MVQSRDSLHRGLMLSPAKRRKLYPINHHCGNIMAEANQAMLPALGKQSYEC
ncbi:hypothetical protein [Massilia sp. YIM B04103]|uniref:hypothetical protein n=1 Tax=Massilia sp. YIM B04103 TaxID=2963106 RepID=UPI00210DAB00|nr:hypothetical protein [Massilia sp. YIM B04103]